jgi:hypothetical protein
VLKYTQFLATATSQTSFLWVLLLLQTVKTLELDA